MIEGKIEGGILGTVHETATSLLGAGVIDKATMREFDARCLTPVAPVGIKALRERGEKRPAGPSLKRLN